jgi:hypothetical protein
MVRIHPLDLKEAASIEKGEITFNSLNSTTNIAVLFVKEEEESSVLEDKGEDADVDVDCMCL